MGKEQFLIWTTLFFFLIFDRRANVLNSSMILSNNLEVLNSMHQIYVAYRTFTKDSTKYFAYLLFMYRNRRTLLKNAFKFLCSYKLPAIPRLSEICQF